LLLVAQLFSFLARFWMNAFYPKAQDLLSQLLTKNKNSLASKINIPV
jgi:hypothetical protein